MEEGSAYANENMRDFYDNDAYVYDDDQDDAYDRNYIRGYDNRQRAVDVNNDDAYLGQDTGVLHMHHQKLESMKRQMSEMQKQMSGLQDMMLESKYQAQRKQELPQKWRQWQK